MATESIDLTLKDPEPGATIYFTLDGSTPTNASFEFDGHAIKISRTGTIIRAFAQVRGKGPSTIVEVGPFRIRAAKAALTVQDQVEIPGVVMPCQEAGNCVPSVDVVVQVARESEHAHCTIDGSTPTPASPLCSDGVQVTKTGTIVKAIVLGESVEPSEIEASQPLTVACYPPSIEPFGGAFADHTVVTIKSSQAGSTVYLTLDGIKPTLASQVYNGPLTIGATGTIVSAMEVASACEISTVTKTPPFGIKTIAPMFEPDGGTFQLDGTQPTVTITSRAGSLVYYTVQFHGAAEKPISQYALYSTPIQILGTNTRVKAVAREGGKELSDIINVNYTLS